MIGRRIQQYEIREKLGEGGMGVVYRADDTRLGRAVALKFLHPSVLGSAEQSKRLLAEARAAAGLSHPNICTIYEINEGDGEAFIAMQFVDGTTLRDRVLSGHIQVDEALRILMQIAEGLAEAHRQGIVHRDMKSSNIMITRSGRAVIMDFGLARPSGPMRPEERFSSRGTSSYMSPEHSRGDAIDQRADIWSLGVILYEMLSGQLPFRGDYEAAVTHSILNDAPRPLGELRPGLPDDVARIVEHCLEKNAFARFQSLDELLVALRAAMAPPRADERRSWSRLRVASVAAVAVLTLAAALFTYDFFRGRQAGGEERVPIAVIDFNNDAHEPALESLSGMLITALEQSRRLQVMTRSRMFDILKTMGEKDATRIDESLGQRICDAADVRALVIPTVRRFGDLYSIDLKVLDTRNHRYIYTAREEGRGLESVPHMIDEVARGIRIDFRDSQDAVASTAPVGTLTTVDMDAYQAYFEGESRLNRLDFDAAGKSFQTAIRMDSTFALAYYRLAYTEWWARGQQEVARRHVAYAMGNLQRIPVKERYLVRALSAGLEQGFTAQIPILREMRRLYPDDKEMLFGLGDAEFHSGSVDSSIVHFKAALAIDPVMERALQHLSWAYQSRGMDAEALATARRWVDATHAVEAYEFLAGCYTRAGQFDDAVAALDLARSREPQSPLIPLRMAAIRFRQRRFDEAMAQSTAAEELLRTHNDFAARAELWHLRAGILYPYSGRYRDIIRVLDESETILAQTPPDSIAVAGIRMSKAVLGYWGDQDAKRALASLEQIREPAETHARGDFAQVRIVLNFVAGDSTRALELLHTEGSHLSPDGRAVVDAVEAMARGDCNAGSRTVAQRKSFGANRAARDVLRYMSARCLIESGHGALAIPELLAVVKAPLLNPDAAPCYGPAWFQLGRAYESTGDIRHSIEAYETLLRMWKDGDPDLPMRIQAEARLRALKQAM
jgi:tetratricopeptide (TPR) repeat protein/predicted Ser/Thr protein kinase